jgi:acetyltransferase-like isoleucine patch superfamily enzyme
VNESDSSGQGERVSAGTSGDPLPVKEKALPRGRLLRRFIETRWCLLLNRAHRSVKIGRGVHLLSGARLKGNIEIGDYSVVQRSTILDSKGGFIRLGRECTVNPFCALFGHGGLTIGDYVRIAAHTTVIPANHVFSSTAVPICRQGLTRQGIHIEDDVWVGANVTILDGVRIGRGSVIGAGSVVTRDVPPYSIAVGNPARVIKSRLQAP